MRILQLRFKNLNSLNGEWAIDFTTPEYQSDGIFAITGPTGAGKSTVLDAICLALYGRTPRLKSISTSSNEIMSRRTGECFAEVVFESQGSRFRCHWAQHRAYRKARGNLVNSKHEIVDAVSEIVLENKKREVAAAIENKTGMDFDRFTRSMLLAQGGFAAFLQAVPDERAPILEQITGTDIYSRISKQVHEKQRQEKEKLDLLQAECTGIVMLTPEEEESMTHDLAEKQASESILTNQHKDITSAIEWLNRIMELEQELRLILRETEALEMEQNSFAANRKKLGRARQAAELEAEYALLSSRREQQKEELKTLENSRLQIQVKEQILARKEKDLSTSEEMLVKTGEEQKRENELIREVIVLDAEIADKQNNINEVSSELKTLEYEISAKKKDKTKIEGNLSKISEALSKINRFRKKNSCDADLVEAFTGIEAEVRNLGKLVNSRGTLIENIEQLKKKYHKTFVKQARQKKKHREFETTLDNAESLTKKTSDAIENLLKGETLQQLRTKHEALNDFLKLLKSLSELLKSLFELLTSIEQSNTELADAKKLAVSLKEQISLITGDIEQLSIKQDAMEHEIRHLETEFALRNRISDLESERLNLEDDLPCPLCGALHHPYAEGNIPEVSEIRKALDKVRSFLKKTGTKLSTSTLKKAGMEKDLEQIRKHIKELNHALINNKYHYLDRYRALDDLYKTLDDLYGAPDALYETSDALYETPDALHETPDGLHETPDELYGTPDDLDKIGDKTLFSEVVSGGLRVSISETGVLNSKTGVLNSKTGVLKNSETGVLKQQMACLKEEMARVQDQMDATRKQAEAMKKRINQADQREQALKSAEKYENESRNAFNKAEKQLDKIRFEQAEVEGSLKRGQKDLTLKQQQYQDLEQAILKKTQQYGIHELFASTSASTFAPAYISTSASAPTPTSASAPTPTSASIPVPTSASATSSLSECASDGDLTALLDSLKKRLNTWQRKEKNKYNMEKKAADLEAQLKGLDALLTSLEENLKKKQSDLSRLNVLKDQLNQKRTRLYGTKDSDREGLRVEKQVGQAEIAVKKAREERDQAKMEIQETRTRILSLQESTEKRRIELVETEAAFQLSLEKKAFENEDIFVACRLTGAERDGLEGRAKSLDTRQSENKARQDECGNKLKQKREQKITTKSIENLDKEQSDIQVSLKAVGEKIGAMKQKMADNESAKIKYRAKRLSIEVQQQEWNRWNSLHSLIGSSDGKKFRNFAQGLTFEIMVSHANRQLSRMTDRYLLVRDVKEPLELNVVDNYQAGEIRSTKNLSGGESFIVSLSLALGLSAMASRKVRVDSLFLDEGFGTLDEDALETALESLAGLQQDGKLIGIISHVPALKERIGTQIAIEPVSGGKSVITGPGCQRVTG